MSRSMMNHISRWNAEPVYRFRRAADGMTRDSNKSLTVVPWIPIDPDDPEEEPPEYNEQICKSAFRLKGIAKTACELRGITGDLAGFWIRKATLMASRLVWTRSYDDMVTLPEDIDIQVPPYEIPDEFVN